VWLVVQEDVPQPQTPQPHCLDKSLMSNMYFSSKLPRSTYILNHHYILFIKDISCSSRAKLFQEGTFFIILNIQGSFGHGVLGRLAHGLLNRWTSQLDLGITTEGLERVFSVHNST